MAQVAVISTRLRIWLLPMGGPELREQVLGSVEVRERVLGSGELKEQVPELAEVKEQHMKAALAVVGMDMPLSQMDL